MNRTIISKNLQWYKYIIPVFFIPFLAFIYNAVIQDPNTDSRIYFIFPLPPLILLYLTYKAHQSKQVSYDEQLMYLTLREEEECIPLKDIVSIKLTMDKIAKGQKLWKITYLDKDNQTKSVKILPIWNKGIFKGFHNAVKFHNPKVIIKNTASSWSID